MVSVYPIVVCFGRYSLQVEVQIDTGSLFHFRYIDVSIFRIQERELARALNEAVCQSVSSTVGVLVGQVALRLLK